MSRTTQVSKSDPTIKKFLAATIGPAWKGRTVSIIEEPRGWSHTQYIDDHDHIWYVDLKTFQARATPQLNFSNPARIHELPAAESGSAFVIHERFMGKDIGVEIVISANAIDPAALSVATDALLAKDRKAAVTVLKQCGVFAGLAMAIAEANVKSLAKASGPAPKTERMRGRLDREIATFLGRRG